MSYSRSAFAAAATLCALLASPVAAHGATAATLDISAAGKRALKQSSLALSVPKLTVRNATVGSSAKLALSGSLRFKSGRRTVTATSLSLTVGRTSSYVSARLGTRSTRLLTVTPTRPAQLDAARGSATLTGARVAFSPAGAKAVRTALKLKRTPSTKTLGRLSVSYTRPPADVVLPTDPPPATTTPAAPAPIATATPTPSPTATPGEQPCGHAPTPVGRVDWFACQLPGSNDLKSWTNYLHVPFPSPPGCATTPGSVTASGGAARIDAASDLDHRFTVASAVVRDDGSATIVADGTVTYAMPAHGIEESTGAFRIEIAPGGLTATVYADGTAKTRDQTGGGCAVAPTPYTDRAVLTLDLSHSAPVVAGGVRRWVGAPATIPTDHLLFGGGSYRSGTAWGAFTIAIPG